MVDCRYMIDGDMDAIQLDRLHTSMYTKIRKSEMVNNKLCVVFSYCDALGNITNNKGIIDKKIGKYCRCLSYDGRFTCNIEWPRRSIKFHQCSNQDGIGRQTKLEELGKKKFSGSETNDDLNNKVENRFLLCRLVCCSAISIQAAVSDHFYDFLYHSMKCYKANNNYSEPSDFLKKCSRNELANSIVSKGKSILEENLDDFATHYGSIVTDGYTKRKRKIKAFMVIFPQFAGENFLVKLLDIDNSQQSFAKAAASVLDILYQHHINISTINCDGYSLILFFNFYFYLFYYLLC